MSPILKAFFVILLSSIVINSILVSQQPGERLIYGALNGSGHTLIIFALAYAGEFLSRLFVQLPRSKKNWLTILLASLFFTIVSCDLVVGYSPERRFKRIFFDPAIADLRDLKQETSSRSKDTSVIVFSAQPSRELIPLLASNNFIDASTAEVKGTEFLFHLSGFKVEFPLTNKFSKRMDGRNWFTFQDATGKSFFIFSTGNPIFRSYNND